MPTWLFALVVFGIGLGIAFYVDRLKSRDASNPAEDDACGRYRWLTYWFTGRLPDKDDCGEKRRKGEERGKPRS